MTRPLASLLARFDHMPGSVRVVAKVGIDALLIIVAFNLAVLVRFGLDVPPQLVHALAYLLPYVLALKVLTFCYFNLNRDLWRYSGFHSLGRLVRGVAIASLVVATFAYLVDFGPLPRSIFLVDGILTLLLVGGVRTTVRWLREGSPRALRSAMDPASADAPDFERVLIVGAGRAGEMITRDMQRQSALLGMVPMGFIDDNVGKRGGFVHGLPVLGSREDIPEVSEVYSIDRIVLCLPFVEGKEIRAIIKYCHQTSARVDIIPPLDEILSGKLKISDVRALKVEDLLGREKVEFKMEQVCSYVQGRKVLVTGAGGSIGSELCRQIVQYGPAEILLLGRGENSIFAIANELTTLAPRVTRREIIGDVINRQKLDHVFGTLKPEIIFHAGADKHVPLMELNPDEAVLNNILGTSNVLSMAEKHGAELVVSISTDKAVRPTSVMGCCKRVAEMLVQRQNPETLKTVAVRFGNVLGSRGSVVPHFQRQIEQGGPVTVTHPKMERYFMTIPEAVALVIQAGALGNGGEVFVLDMGEPVAIAELARQMIRLSGLQPDKDIAIEFTGLRPGEKLTEELEGPGEEFAETDHPKIRLVSSKAPNVENLDARMAELTDAAIEMDFGRIRRLLKEVVKEYSSEQGSAGTVLAFSNQNPAISGPDREEILTSKAPVAGVPLLDLRRQYRQLKGDIDSAVQSVFDSQKFILGENVAALERECAAAVGVSEAVGVASGTDALWLTYRALELQAGDEVVTSPFSFFATAGAVINAGARPVFADIDPVTFNLDPAATAAACGERTRALCVVHLFGQSADVTALTRLLAGREIPIVEDACQSLGARHGEQAVGALGVAGAFSFFPSKNLGGAGDGGLVTFTDEKLATRVRALRHHGQTGTYQHAWVGSNSRLDELQAAVLRVKLRHLESWNEARRANARALAERLLGSGLQVKNGGPLDGADISLPVEADGGRHVFNQFTVRARDRDGLLAFLRERQIGCAVYYPLPLHLQPCFASLGHREGEFPHAEQASREVISLPVFPELTSDELDRVAEAVALFYH